MEKVICIYHKEPFRVKEKEKGPEIRIVIENDQDRFEFQVSTTSNFWVVNTGDKISVTVRKEVKTGQHWFEMHEILKMGKQKRRKLGTNKYKWGKK